MGAGQCWKLAPRGPRSCCRDSQDSSSQHSDSGHVALAEFGGLSLKWNFLIYLHRADFQSCVSVWCLESDSCIYIRILLRSCFRKQSGKRLLYLDLGKNSWT